MGSAAKVLINSGFARHYNNYLHKKEETKRRGIAFNLTAEEFSFLKDESRKYDCCDYTGKHFSKRADEDGRTMERIDARKGYEIGNICFVTYQANGLKGKVIDNDMGETLSDEEQVLLGQIRAVLNDKKKLNEIRMKYIPKNHPLYVQMQKSVNEPTKQTKAKVVPIKKTEPIETNIKEKPVVESKLPKKPKNGCHKDVRLAHTYLKLSEGVEKQGVEFDLSFNQFVMKCKRKTCSLTKRDLESPFIMRVNRDHSFNDKNILVVERKVADALTDFLDTTGLSIDDFRKVANRLFEANRNVDTQEKSV